MIIDCNFSRNSVRKAVVFLFLAGFLTLFDGLLPAVATSQSCSLPSGYFPTSTWPSFVVYKDVRGYSIKDPANDQNPPSIDIVPGSGADSLSCAVAMDGTNVFVRMQLRDSPINPQGGGNLAWDQYMWQVYIADGNGYSRAVIGFDGKSNPEVVYVCDSLGGNYVAVYNYGTHPDCARYVANASGTYYFDFQVPLCYIEYVSCMAHGYPNRITADSPIRLYFATSASIATINKDFSYGSSLSWTDMHMTSFTSIQGGSLNPVELVSFMASAGKSAVVLKWTTATETNNYGFEIERSYDGTTWSVVNFVSGNGTSNRPNRYTYHDPFTAELSRHERVLYRLRQIDRDGKTTELPVISVALAKSSRIELAQNYPNPVDEVSSGSAKTNITFTLAERESISLTVHDALGREVRRLYSGELLDAGSYVSILDCRDLPAGRYFYRLIHAGGIVSRSLLVVR